MVVLFSKFLDGKPTFFREKIVKGICEALSEKQNHFLMDYARGFSKTIFLNCRPKIHTIRRDKEDKFEKGVKLELVYNEGFEQIVDEYCTGTQEIFMTFHRFSFQMSIEDRFIYLPEMQQIATNDGFESLEDFIKYFVSKMDSDGCYSGKIIHWTDFKY